MSFQKKTGERESQEDRTQHCVCVISKYKSANQSKVAVFFAATSFTGRRYDGDGILTDERVDWNESS